MADSPGLGDPQPRAGIDGGQTTPADKGTSLSALIFLEMDELPANSAIAERIAARIPGFTVPGGGPDDHASPFLAIAGSALCTVMKFSAAYPLSPDERAFIISWVWQTARSELSKHKAHLIVSVTGIADPKQRSIVHAHVVAAALEASRTPIGVHFAASDQLLPARAVVAAVPHGANDVPVPLSVSVALARDTVGFWKKKEILSARTLGLDEFGIPEIAAVGFTGTPYELYTQVLDIASYLINSGRRFNDGDTTGPDEKTKVPVSVIDAAPGSNKKLYHLSYGPV